MKKTYFSVKEAAEFSGLSKWYLYKLTALRAIPICKIGSRCLIPVEDFKNWIDKNRIDSKGGEK